MSLRINDWRPISQQRPRKGRSGSTTGSATAMPFFSAIRRISRPVCTTELGYMAGLEGEFAKRNAKIIGISVDPVESHEKWKADITKATGQNVNYPMIGDPDMTVAKLYDMLPASAAGEASARTPADNQTVRSVFVIGPDKKVKLILTYPMTTGRNFEEILRAHQFDPADGQAPGRDAGRVEAGRGRHHHGRGERRGRAEALRRLRARIAIPAQDRAAAGLIFAR